MNILDVLILLVLAFCLLAGMHKGFISSLLSTVGFVGSWFGARAIYERIANMVLSNTTLMAVLNQYLEPETFFSSSAQAATTVTEVVSGGEVAIKAAVAPVAERISVISRAFEANIRNQAFTKLNIYSLSDYLDQTVWQAVFNVLAFLLAFAVLYILAALVVNLLDHVVPFPVLRMFDWLAGGAFGLVRGLVVVVLILCVLPSVVSLVSPELIQKLISESQLYSFVSNLDLLNVAGTVAQLIG